jgi:hypothetical protein
MATNPATVASNRDIQYGKSVSRVTAPHPNNSGADALRAGIARVNKCMANDKASKPDRTGQSE